MPASDHLGPQWWHGSPSGELHGSDSGIHIGTREAARQALHARIGRPAQGEWDGTREYGKTVLAPYGYGSTRDSDFHMASGNATYSDRTPVPLDARPNLFPVDLVGRMTNTRSSPHPDWHANGYMRSQLKQGRAKSGYYYTNIAEDSGSVSAVVPNAEHLRKLGI